MGAPNPTWFYWNIIEFFLTLVDLIRICIESLVFNSFLVLANFLLYTVVVDCKPCSVSDWSGYIQSNRSTKIQKRKSKNDIIMHTAKAEIQRGQKKDIPQNFLQPEKNVNSKKIKGFREHIEKTQENLEIFGNFRKFSGYFPPSLLTFSATRADPNHFGHVSRPKFNKFWTGWPALGLKWIK